MNDLYRVETVLSALNRGTSSEWAEEHIIAHGMSGQRNPLGNAIDHLIAHPTAGNFNFTVYLLSGELQRQRIGRVQDSVDIARDALEYFITRNCPSCCGAGKNFEQEDCMVCGGTGRRVMPEDPIKSAISVIEWAQEWMENQLRKRLSNYYHYVGITDKYVITEPATGQESNGLKAIKKMLDNGC